MQQPSTLFGLSRKIIFPKEISYIFPKKNHSEKNSYIFSKKSFSYIPRNGTMYFAQKFS